jgi:hypothetical protein
MFFVVYANREQWLQANRQVELFDEVFVLYRPELVQSFSQLVILSVCAAVSIQLSTNRVPRLRWMEVALNFINPRVSQIYDCSSMLFADHT